jgi:ubiquinone/menaquinone biosynthesis C-methylase UbiE
VDVRRAAAEELPFADGEFDAALAQLVVHFMADPARGLAEMTRVTRPSGVVSACVWDHEGEQTPLAWFWQAVREFDPGAEDESELAGSREGHLAELFAAAGLREVEDTALPVRLEHATFEEWWEPFTLGVALTGSYVAKLDSAQQVELRELCRRRLPPAPFTVSARAWAACGVV